MNKPKDNHVFRDDWIKENISRFDSFVPMCAEHNKLFETDISSKYFRTHCSKIGLPLGRFVFSEEQEQFISKNFPVLGATETTRLFNELYGTNKSVANIKTHCYRKGIKCLEETRSQIQKNVTNNLLVHNEKVSARVGEVGRPSNGYDYIKTEKGWVRYNKYVWEQHFGKMPEGHSIIFLDGNNKNFDISNLACVQNKVLTLMNHNCPVKSGNPELKKAAIKYCELYFMLGGQKGIRQILGVSDEQIH